MGSQQDAENEEGGSSRMSDLPEIAQPRVRYSLSESVQARGTQIEALVGIVTLEIDRLLAPTERCDGAVLVLARKMPLAQLRLFVPDPGASQVAIDLNQHPNMHLATLIHEFGHAIDSIFIPGIDQRGRKYSSVEAASGSGPLQAWWSMVTVTDKFRELDALANDT